MTHHVIELRPREQTMQETFHIPEGSGKTFQSNMKDFVRSYFVHDPKTTSFTQLLRALRRVESLQTATGRAKKRRRAFWRQATERSGVWEGSDVENAD